MQINLLTQPLDNIPHKVDVGEKTPKVLAKPVEAPVESERVKDEKFENLQNSLAEHNITLKFRLDEQTKQLVVELVDGTTGDAIKQFPSEVSLKLSAMNIKMQGQFLDDKG